MYGLVSSKQLVKGKDLVFYNKCLTEFVSLLEGKFIPVYRKYLSNRPQVSTCMGYITIIP